MSDADRPGNWLTQLISSAFGIPKEKLLGNRSATAAKAMAEEASWRYPYPANTSSAIQRGNVLVQDDFNNRKICFTCNCGHKWEIFYESLVGDVDAKCTWCAARESVANTGTLLANGVTSFNEARAALGMPPLVTSDDFRKMPLPQKDMDVNRVLSQLSTHPDCTCACHTDPNRTQFCENVCAGCAGLWSKSLAITAVDEPKEEIEALGGKRKINLKS